MSKKTAMVILVITTLVLSIVPVALADDSVTVTYAGYTSQLNLENKDPGTWQFEEDGIGGILYYNNSGSTFDFTLDVQGLPAGDYALIYYADTQYRFVDWGGVVDGVGQVIQSFTVNADPFSTSGSVDLGMDLPSYPDANAYYYDYTQAPDNYAHATGAKLWVVPTSVLSSGVMPVATWAPDDTWLFETDLITYDDTDITSPELVGISVSPDTLDLHGTTGSTATGTVTISNTGLVQVDVSVTVPTTGVLSGLTYDWASTDEDVSTIDSGGSDDCTLSLIIPEVGTDSGTVTFNATPTTTP